jgi:hypothetical protein
VTVLKRKFVRIKPIWIIIALLLLAAVGWAIENGLDSQINATAADAGKSVADSAFSALDLITVPQPEAAKKAPPVDWAKEKSLKKQLENIKGSYTSLVSRAKTKFLPQVKSQPA